MRLVIQQIINIKLTTMAFLVKEEMKTVMYQYQLEQITEEDDTIIETGINVAVEEVRSYLTPNSKKAWQDGRLVYDVDAVFSATGNDRNALLLEYTKVCAEWQIIKLCNADIIYDHVKERYDRVVAWLRQLAAGDVSISSLPTLDPEGENVINKEPFAFGSRTKFNHE